MVVKVRVDGEDVSARVLALSRDAAKAAKVNMPRVLQGSWSNAGVSAGTHTGGGAIDYGVLGMTYAQQEAFVVELRRRNGCVTQPMAGPRRALTSTASCVTSLTSPGVLSSRCRTTTTGRTAWPTAGLTITLAPSRSLTTPSSGPLLSVGPALVCMTSPLLPPRALPGGCSARPSPTWTSSLSEAVVGFVTLLATTSTHLQLLWASNQVHRGQGGLER